MAVTHIAVAVAVVVVVMSKVMRWRSVMRIVIGLRGRLYVLGLQPRLTVIVVHMDELVLSVVAVVVELDANRCGMVTVCVIERHTVFQCLAFEWQRST